MVDMQASDATISQSVDAVLASASTKELLVHLQHLNELLDANAQRIDQLLRESMGLADHGLLDESLTERMVHALTEGIGTYTEEALGILNVLAGRTLLAK